ncbi:Uncharacterised protein [Mycobacteroides abscessus subsp. abscessus]|nr:Uncharacterised protein [Mycobacteroides abscessus subsp. abscessus]
MASMTRESSPPEAILAMSSPVEESCGAKVRRMSSRPWTAGSRSVISKRTCALGIDRAVSSSLTAAENDSAVDRRRALRAAPVSRMAASAASSSPSSWSRSRSSASSSVSSAAARVSKARTSSTVSP